MAFGDYAGMGVLIAFGVWWVAFPETVIRFYTWFHRRRISPTSTLAIRLAGVLWLTLIGISFHLNGRHSSVVMDDVVHTVVDANDWKSALENRRCVLFVDCQWNQDVAACRFPFSQFAVWCRKNSDYLPVRVELDAVARGEMWDIVQELWKANSIVHGGLKDLGGAGRIVWLENGNIRDCAWCSEVPDKDSLMHRTENAFH